jgi:hypothetical protein
MKGTDQMNEELEEWSSNFLELIVDLANENRGDTAQRVKQIFATCEVVFGVWQDASKPHGVDFIFLKGSKSFRKIAASGMAAEKKISAISCRQYEEAVAIKNVWGDCDYDA